MNCSSKYLSTEITICIQLFTEELHFQNIKKQHNTNQKLSKSIKWYRDTPLSASYSSRLKEAHISLFLNWFRSLPWNPANILMLWLWAGFGCSPLVALVVSPKGGILSSPQNFNLVCLGCFAVGAEEPKPRLNMRDKRPANRLSLARGEKWSNSQQTLSLSFHESGI